MPNQLMIVGACARPYVESARRAGLEPLGVDLFADWDTRQAGCSLQVDSLDEVPSILQQYPHPWCLSGGLERHLDRLFTADIAERFLGPPADALRLINDIGQLEQLTERCGFRFPQLNFDPFCPPGDWLCKPAAGSGGHAIQTAVPGADRPAGEYFQARVAGPTLSGLYVTSPTQTRLLGATWQLLRRDLDQHATPFAYAGSIGPLQLDAKLESQLRSFGQQVGAALPMRGVWGTDFVCPGDELLVVDINPRLTASTDLYEGSRQLPSVVGLHLHACRATGRGPLAHKLLGEQELTLWAGSGKVIVYSPSDESFCIDDRTHNWLAQRTRPGQPSRLADIPHPGQRIPPHGPICTLYETVPGDDMRVQLTPAGLEASDGIHQLRLRLKRRAHHLFQQLEAGTREAGIKNGQD